ncbi:SDR family oxidoreductase [Micromonospora chokoriensis]
MSAPTILVTGANRGIGLEFVRQYAALGRSVTATCRKPDDAEELHVLARRHHDITVLQLDVTDDSSIAGCVAALGETPLDLLLNNAGCYGRASGELDALDKADWTAMFEVNTMGPLLVTRALLPALRRAAAPKVVGLSSVKASIGRNHMGASYQYRSTKAAFNALLRSLAVDLRPTGISVYALSPGWVDQGEDVSGGLSFDDRLRKARRFFAEFGGSSARVGLTESVRSMVATIDRLSPADSGEFFDHTGRPLPW